jgi:hypothetical protein
MSTAGESNVEQVLAMLTEVETNLGMAPALSSHVTSDADKFNEIFRRLDALEKRVLGT